MFASSSLSALVFLIDNALRIAHSLKVYKTYKPFINVTQKLHFKLKLGLNNVIVNKWVIYLCHVFSLQIYISGARENPFVNNMRPFIKN